MTLSTTTLIESQGMLRGVLRLALPVLAEQLLWMMVGFSDTLLTGRYFDATHLAAVNLMVYVLWLMSSVFLFVGIGATAMVARFVGAEDRPLASRVMNQAILVGAGISLVCLVLGLAGGATFVRVLRLEGSAATLAAQYLEIVIPTLPCLMLQTVGVACLRGAGDMVSGLVAMAMVNIVNILMSWGLVLGIGPLPELGWKGIAVGTLCGNLVGGLIILGLLIAGRGGLRLELAKLMPDVDLIRRLLRVGVPGGIDGLSVVVCQLWFVALVNRLGDVAAAAHGVAIRIESLAYLPGLAFQVAAATLAGQFLGARDYDRASRSVVVTLAVATGIMTAVGFVFVFAAEPLAGIFISACDSQVAPLAASLLRIVALAMPALAFTMVLSGALRGAGDTRWPLAFTWLGYLGVRIPGTYVLTGYLGFGVRGAWYMMVTDLVLRCMLISYRFWHGGWKQTKV